jgi:hypothetical protein
VISPLFALGALLAGSTAAAAPPAEAGARLDLAPIIRRMCETERFHGSKEEFRTRTDAGRFFSASEYALLEGNPILGYFANQGFAWEGDASISWGGLVARHPSARGLRPESWAVAFEQAAKLQGLAVDAGARVQVEGACVAAVTDPNAASRVPGVLVELRFRSPGGTLLFRTGVGKRTVADAMGAAMDLAIRFARTGGKRLCP